MELSKELKEKLKAHALEDVTKECCGLLVQSKDIQYIPLINKSKNEEESFIIDYIQLKEAEKHGKIIGLFHSHGEETFSVVDKHIAEKRNLISVIYKTKLDEFEVYEPIGLEIPYTGRSFAMGIFDCFTLAQDYYLRELNIQLTEFNHKHRYTLDLAETEENYSDNPVTKNHLLENGFSQVNDLKKHDIILNRYGKVKFPTHHLIYLGQNKILHHPFFDPSSIEEYTEQFKKLTMGVFRHNSNL